MSIYSNKHKYIFLHIPKNAGTAIRRALADVDPSIQSFDAIDEANRETRDPAYANHFPLWKIQELLAETDLSLPLSEMKIFMVVRNPWERMVSLYFHRMRKLMMSYEGKPRNTPEAIAVAKQGFVPWLIGTPHEGDKVLTRTSQMSWGRDDEGLIGAAYIVRIEDLEDEWMGLCNELGVKTPRLLKLNKGSGDSKSYRDHYTVEANAFVTHYFAEDIKEFGYEF